MDTNDGAASFVRSDALFGAIGKCVEAAERYPTTLTVATQPAGEITIGKDVWRVDIAIYKRPNKEISIPVQRGELNREVS